MSSIVFKSAKQHAIAIQRRSIKAIDLLEAYFEQNHKLNPEINPDIWQNRKAAKYEYQKQKGSANSTWMSRNMITSGSVILAFLVLHFIDFWVPEMNHKYIEFLPEDPNRYFKHLVHKFENPLRVAMYCLAFVLLALHLLHGFTSSLRSMGTNKSYVASVKTVGIVYSIGIPLGFCVIAIFHYLNHLFSHPKEPYLN